MTASTEAASAPSRRYTHQPSALLGGEGKKPLRDRAMVTPDGRYIVVRGRLWRAANPSLNPKVRKRLVGDLMAARRQAGIARRKGDQPALALARAGVEAAKVGLGERGPVWWRDAAPDLTGRMARTTHYADWFRSTGPDSAEEE